MVGAEPLERVVLEIREHVGRQVPRELKRAEAHRQGHKVGLRGRVARRPDAARALKDLDRERQLDLKRVRHAGGGL